MMDSILPVVEAIAKHLKERHSTLTTAESCTGGAIAKALTEIPGASSWFEMGWVTYSNAAKTALLGVEEQLLQTYGAVSQEVVEAMAQGALSRAQAQYAIAVTGIAGPDGGTKEKPVGTVWIGWTSVNACYAKQYRFTGNREEIRSQTVLTALTEWLKWYA